MSEKQKRKRKGERPDGLIQRSLQIGYRPDGKPDRKYFYGHTAAEAERKRDEYKARLEAGSNLDASMTLAEWIDVYLETYRTNVNAAYLNNDSVPYNRLKKSLGKRKLSSIRENDLQAELNRVAGMSFSTADKYRQAIKRVFEKARKNRLIPDNPAEDLSMPKHTKGTHRALESWEFDLILNNWNHPDARAGLWIMLMLLCGLRRGEMMGLEWDAIDLESRTLEVRQVAVIRTNQSTIEQRAKTDAGLRTLPICNSLYDALCSVPVEERQGFVCTSAKGKPLTLSSASRGVERFCTVMERIANGEETNLQGKKLVTDENDESRIRFSFKPHDLRHTYATALFDSGVPAKVAQYFLGHADIRITLDLYTHLSKERQTSSRNQTIEYLDRWIDERTRNALPFASENKPELP